RGGARRDRPPPRGARRSTRTGLPIGLPERSANGCSPSSPGHARAFHGRLRGRPRQAEAGARGRPPSASAAELIQNGLGGSPEDSGGKAGGVVLSAGAALRHTLLALSLSALADRLLLAASPLWALPHPTQPPPHSASLLCHHP